MPDQDGASLSGVAPATLLRVPGDGSDKALSPFIRGVLDGPPRIAGTRLPVILGWTFLGLIALACFAGLGLVVYTSGDLIGRSVYANAERTADEREDQNTSQARGG